MKYIQNQVIFYKKEKLVKKEKESLRSKKCFRLARNSVANVLLMKTSNNVKTFKLNMIYVKN